MKRNLLSIVRMDRFFLLGKEYILRNRLPVVSSYLAREYFAPIQVKDEVFRAMEIILHLYFLSCEDRLKLSSCDGRYTFSSIPPIMISKLLRECVVY